MALNRRLFRSTITNVRFFNRVYLILRTTQITIQVYRWYHMLQSKILQQTLVTLVQFSRVQEDKKLKLSTAMSVSFSYKTNLI
jgi:hypothetical protein